MTGSAPEDSGPDRPQARPRLPAWAIPAFLIAVFLAQCAWFIETQSFVVDEPIHIEAGLDAWRNHRFAHFDDHPPLARMWCALPLIGRKWQMDSTSLVQAEPMTYVLPDAQAMARRARGMTVLFGLLLAAILWFTTRSLLSAGAANLALALFVLNPAMVAHFSLATNDGAAALFTFATAACLVRWRRNPSPALTLALGAILGLLLIAKFSTPPMFLLAVFWILASAPPAQASPQSPARLTRPFSQWNWGKALAAVLVAAVVVWGGYLFHITRVTVRDGTFTLSSPNRPPVLAPAPKNLNFSLYVPGGEYLEGFRSQLRHNTGGHASFFLGERSQRGGFRLYFPVDIILKWPTVLLLLLAAGIFLAARRIVPLSTDFRILASFPVIYFLFALASRLNIGDRHILPLYPFAFLFAAVVWEFAAPRPALVAAVVFALLLLAADIVRYAPDDLSYFNPFVSPPQSYRLLSDSNLDWGQGLLAVKQYELSHPDENISVEAIGLVSLDVYGIRARRLAEGERATGTVIVGASVLTGQFLRDPDSLNWLQQYPRYEKMLDHSMFIFRVPTSPDDASSTARNLAPLSPAPFIRNDAK